MVKGDEHYIYSNTVFDTKTNNGIFVDASNSQNFLTETMNNLADGISGDKTDGSVSLSGFDTNNLDSDGDSIRSDLMNPENFNFCPIPGSDIASAGVGAYDSDCE